MGSSVIHGGLSTFFAIVVLVGARSYIFVVFFKLFFGIIVFGMANGFLLLPIILSFIGPVSEDEEVKIELQRRNSFRRQQSLKSEKEFDKKITPQSETKSDIMADKSDVNKSERIESV